jgi:tetratricopeptide (TPR) repeat protein
MNIIRNLTGNFLDTVTKAALMLLIVITTVMLVQERTATSHAEGPRPDNLEQLKKMYQKRIARDKKIYLEVETLSGQKQYAAALDKLREIQEQHPDNPLSLIYQARLQYNMGKMASAIESYRQAVDKEPDYIDQKTPLFIGKAIMEHLDESKGKLVREIKLRPKDKQIRQALDKLLYLQRRVAGGCE